MTAFPVSITGRNEEGYYQLSRFRVAQPRDWSALETAFAEKLAVAGTVTEVVKGGLSVDVGVRAFMPASRSGTRDAAELEALVGQQIQCRITKLDVADENVVVDRRVVLEEQARGEMENRRAAMREGDTVTGTVRTLMPYGAFVEHRRLRIRRNGRPAARQRHLLQPRQQAGRRALRRPGSCKSAFSRSIRRQARFRWASSNCSPRRGRPRRSVTLPGQRITGTVTRLTDFGAFVELEVGRGRHDPHLGDVVGQEGAASFGPAQAGRSRGCGGAFRQAAHRLGAGAHRTRPQAGAWPIPGSTRSAGSRWARRWKAR